MSGIAFAGDAAPSKLDILVGDQLAAVAATPDTADDGALAKKLLEMSALVTEKDLKRQMYEKAYDLGLRDPSGFAAAGQAIQLLQAEFPDTKEACQEKLLTLAEYRYRRVTTVDASTVAMDYLRRLVVRGDQAMDQRDYANAQVLYSKAVLIAQEQKLTDARKELEFRADLAVKMAQATKDAAAFKAKIESDPKDLASTQKLARLLLIELDDSAGAAALAPRLGTDPLAAIVTLAAKETKALDASESLQMGRWFHAEADAGNNTAKLIGYDRALACYNRFLAVKTTVDADRLAVESAVSRVKKALATLGERSLNQRQQRLANLRMAEATDRVTDVSEEAPASAKVFLADMKEAGTANLLKGTFGKKPTWEPFNPVVVKGVRYKNGIFVHPTENKTCSISYTLTQKFSKFKGAVAINDSAGPPDHRGTATPLIFRIDGDGKNLWKSRALQARGETEQFEVDIRGVESLRISVECPGKDWDGHAVWIDPVCE